MSWEQLRAIAQENAQTLEDERSEPPVACPHHGEPLQVRESDGVRNCPFGDYRWNG